jgi:hypothetical protein
MKVKARPFSKLTGINLFIDKKKSFSFSFNLRQPVK